MAPVLPFNEITRTMSVMRLPRLNFADDTEANLFYFVLNVVLVFLLLVLLFGWVGVYFTALAAAVGILAGLLWMTRGG